MKCRVTRRGAPAASGRRLGRRFETLRVQGGDTRSGFAKQVEWRSILRDADVQPSGAGSLTRRVDPGPTDQAKGEPGWNNTGCAVTERRTTRIAEKVGGLLEFTDAPEALEYFQSRGRWSRPAHPLNNLATASETRT